MFLYEYTLWLITAFDQGLMLKVALKGKRKYIFYSVLYYAYEFHTKLFSHIGQLCLPEVSLQTHSLDTQRRKPICGKALPQTAY